MRSRKDERGAYSDVVVCYWQIGSQRRLWRLDELVLGAGYKHCYNFYTVYTSMAEGEVAKMLHSAIVFRVKRTFYHR